ncbi:hypothetical protein [Nemorincola caseinilytica]
MKRISLISLLCAIVFASCSKNNCYTCVLYKKANDKTLSQTKFKYCRIKRSDIEQMEADSARTWTATDSKGVVYNMEQVLDCTVDNYW